LKKRHPARSTRSYLHGTFSSLKIRNYRLYFIGQGLSLCGTWMQVVGQAWLVLKVTNSGTALGLVLALQYLPILLLAPVGGMFADRFNKRRVLYVTQAGSGILALVLGEMLVQALYSAQVIKTLDIRGATTEFESRGVFFKRFFYDLLVLRLLPSAAAAFIVGFWPFPKTLAWKGFSFGKRSKKKA